MPFDSQTTRGDAGALIPEEVSNEILKEIPPTSFALSTFRQKRMSTKTTRQPVLDVLPKAYWVNGDTGMKQTSNQAWANKFLEAEELAVIIPIPENVVDDAGYPIWEEIKPEVAAAFGQAIDEAVLFGINRPASWPLSIVEGAIASGNVLTASGLSSTTDIAIDIGDAIGMVRADGFRPDAVTARVELETMLLNLRDNQRQPVFAPSLIQGQPDKIHGRPITYLENGAWPDAAAGVPLSIVGSSKAAVIGMRADIRFKMFDTGVITDNAGNIVYNLMQQDMLALRATMRVGYQTINTATRLNPNSATRYPFAVVRQA